MATSITFGSDSVNYQTVHSESYQRAEINSKDREAFKENSKYLRGHHFAFGSATRDLREAPTASKDAFRDPGKQFFKDFAERAKEKADEKAQTRKANFTLGCDEDPNLYKSIQTVEISEPARMRPARGEAEEGDGKVSTLAARGVSFTLGSDKVNYSSTASAAHVHFKNLEPAIDLKERTRALRQSSFIFGTDDVDYSSAAGRAFNGTGFAEARHQALAEAAEGGGAGGVRGVNFKYGNNAVDYNSENRRSFSNVEALNAHCRNPTRLNPETKRELRMQHFDFGSDAINYKSLGQASYGGAGMDDPVRRAEVLREKENLDKIKKDLRATHIHLGAQGGKLQGVTASRSAFLAPTSKQLCQAAEDRSGVQDRGVHFTLGTDDEELRRIRSVTLTQETMQAGASGAAEAKLAASRDRAISEDPRSCHVYMGSSGGVGAEQWKSTSAANFVHHKDAVPMVMSEQVRKDLRASHYQLGGEEGYPKGMKSTMHEHMSYYGPAPKEGGEERSNKTNFYLGHSAPIYKSTAGEAFSWPGGGGPKRR